MQDIEFDINFEQSLFHSKYLSWIDQIVVDSSISLYNPVEDLFSHNKSGSQLIHTIDHLQNLSSNLNTWVQNKTHRPSFDFRNTPFASTATQTISHLPPSSSHVFHTTQDIVNPPLSILNIQILVLNPPPPPPPVMVARYAPLVFTQNPGAMPLDYQIKITFLDSNQTITT